MTDKAAIINRLGRVPLLGCGLRWIARHYPEGSVVTINNGPLAGHRWKRSHKYVNSYWLGTYELHVQNCLARELKSGNIFYDIGANAGFFSLLGVKCVGEKGQVYIFEPLPENIRTIKNQFELNHVNNAKIIEAAVSDHIGNAELFQGEDTYTATITQKYKANRDCHIVKTITLDEFTKTAPTPNFIKMDVEGAEILVLRGSKKLLNSDNPPGLLIELHGQDIARQVCEIL